MTTDGDPTKPIVSSSVVELSPRHYDAAPIDEWLKKTATFGNEMRCLAG